MMRGQHNLSPVKQNNADGYVLLLIASFGVTVILVRLFLEFTGYPQIGDSTFHIAHLLWGGLLLFVAIGAVLVFANHWAYYLGALLGGIGTGLFIDEVGKFITQSNDYFYPLAFPIIYAFTIICVWLYLRVRRTATHDTRTLLYRVFDNMKEILDRDLDIAENKELMRDLNLILSTCEGQSERDLAMALLNFVNVGSAPAQSNPSPFDRFVARIIAFLSTTPPRGIFKAILVVGFLVLAIGAFAKLFGLYALVSNGAPDLGSALSQFVVVNGKAEYVVSHPYLLAMQAVLLGAIGLASIATAVTISRGDERVGLRLGTIALLVGLTIVNLLTFYFSQLYALVDALGQLTLIGLAQLYRWRFHLHAIQLPETQAQVQAGVPIRT